MRENFQKKSYIGLIRKNPENHPNYDFCDFTSKNDNLGLKLKILKFSEFSRFNVNPLLILNQAENLDAPARTVSWGVLRFFKKFSVKF